MKEIIERKIKDLEETKRFYIDMIDEGSIFEESYILKQIKCCRDKIDVLKDVIEEFEVKNYEW